ncbi:MAG: isocitrate/isopropylmalate family dehydrogenase [Desulfobacterales bacterium]
MAQKRVCVIEGEDASPEAVRPVVRLIEAMDLGIKWVYPPVGEKGLQQYDSIFPDAARDAIDDSNTTLFGAASGKSVFALMYLRWGKQTFANVRPATFMPGCKSPLARPNGIDFVIVRENTEDLYLMVEGDLEDLKKSGLVSPILQKSVSEIGEGKYGVKVITRSASERIACFAFDLARRRKKEGLPGKVTASSKYNMLSQSDGLFVDIARETAKDYPDIIFETMIVDNLAHFMVMNPEKLDVVLLPNLYGDLLSDAAAGLIGGLGLAPSGCFGTDYAYFEPAHGTAPDIAGKNTINPTATLLSAVMMLEYLGFAETAGEITSALKTVYRKGKCLTPDQGGGASTTEFIGAVARELKINHD